MLNECQVHVRRLRFPDGGAAVDYRTADAIAHRLATDLTRHGVTVTIDNEVHDNLPTLPNTEIWTN
ncbi:hypothetical protein ACQP2U_07910 [Nocardia sp. CA-084685]|uniref:hypothetical protein n=1 Tax=Nocardia sp. CA-084685 TaxID=3239970 RepID=UPI003D964885